MSLYLVVLFQLDESNQASHQQQVWEANAQAVEYARQASQNQGDGFFHPLDCEPTLQIG